MLGSEVWTIMSKEMSYFKISTINKILMPQALIIYKPPKRSK